MRRLGGAGKRGLRGGALHPHARTGEAHFSLSHSLSLFLPPLFSLPGDAVTVGQPLLILEAMKMEHVVKAPMSGSVTAIPVQAGDLLEDGRDVCTIGAAAAPPKK